MLSAPLQVLNKVKDVGVENIINVIVIENPQNSDKTQELTMDLHL